MATWNVRTIDGVRDNLTIYQVQEMLRTGQLQADTEVAQGDDWVPLAEVPALARFMPAANTAPTTDDVLAAHGLVLQRDANGKPILPPPDVIARILETDAARDRTNTELGRRWAVGVGLVVAWFFASVTLYYMFIRPRPPPPAPPNIHTLLPIPAPSGMPAIPAMQPARPAPAGQVHVLKPTAKAPPTSR
jgi:hypothetical protein